MVGWSNDRRIQRNNVDGLSFLAVHHFKWTSGAAARAASFSRSFREQRIRWWVTSARIASYLAESGGRTLFFAGGAGHFECVEPKHVDFAHPSLDMSRSYLSPMELLLERAVLEVRSGTSARGLEVQRPPKPVPPKKRFTVVMMSYSPSRHGNQVMCMTYYANMPEVDQFLFLWNSPGLPLPPVPEDTQAPIVVIVQERNSLNNRYQPQLPVRTDAVLIVDDDTQLPPATLMSMFTRWRVSPEQMVGIASRSFVQGNYMYPHKCCRTHQKMRRPKQTMDEFCDTFHIVLPKYWLVPSHGDPEYINSNDTI